MSLFETSIILVFTFISYFILKFKIYPSLILDLPDSKRKKHVNPVPKLGIIFFIPFLILVNFSNISFEYNNNFIYFSIILIIFGFLDDIMSIRWLGRIFFEFIFISSFLLINQELLLYQININNPFLEIILKFNNIYFYFFFTTFCFVSLVNALNFFDGINNQLSNYLILLFLFFYFKTSDLLCLILIFNLLIFSFFNYKNLVFFGSASIYFLTFIIFNFAIFNHNNFSIGADEILIMLLYPGLDMGRLFFFRIINKKSPFHADRNHIHHILNKNFTHKYVLILNMFPVIICLLIIHFENINNLYGLVFTILYYIAVLNFKKKI